MTMARLAELLEASPDGVPGSFKTVLKGDTIEDIPCTVLGVVPGATADGGDLVLIEATGPRIAEISGIAAGMSGSPLYVEDGGEAKLLAAVSYGDWFTTGGLGLATPVEHMMTLETDYPPSGTLLRLPEPLTCTRGDIDRVIVSARKPAARRDGTLAARPLLSLSVTGLPRDSLVYRELERRLGERGVRLQAGLAGSSGRAPFLTDLVPGAAVGALATRGDVTYGGVGTVTYTTADDHLAAFGHPFGFMSWTGDGACDYYLTNAEVIGVRGSLMAPYKVAAPGALRGRVVRDSGPGILGHVGPTPPETCFTSTATLVPGGTPQTSTVWSPQYCSSDPLNTYGMATLTYPAQFRATGDGLFAGMMDYRLTIEVTDGEDDYIVDRQSSWLSTVDAPFMSTLELMLYLDKLLEDPYGIAPCDVTAVNIDASLTPSLAAKAVITDVKVPGGLRAGDNAVIVTLYGHGDSVPHEAVGTLTIPEGTDLSDGVLYAASPDTGVVDAGGGWFDVQDPVDGWNWGQGRPRRTLAEVVEALNAVPSSGALQLAFDPGESWDEISDLRPWSSDAVVQSVTTDAYLTGIQARVLSRMRLRTPGLRGTLAFRRPLALAGKIMSAARDTTVTITGTEPGGAPQVLAVVPATRGPLDDEWDEPEYWFDHLVRGLRHTTVIQATWDGDDTWLGATATQRVRVAAAVRLTTLRRGGRVVLTAQVRPGDTGGRVIFERRVGSRWYTVARAAVSAGGRSAAAWRAPGGMHELRARFAGSRLNASSTSASQRVIVP